MTSITPRFNGIWVPLVTPFHNNDIDFPALRLLARKYAEAGVAGLVVCGSTGEAAALSEAEQLAVLDAVIEAVPDCRIVMGLSDNNLPSLLQRLQSIQQRPIAGLLVPTPYFIRPSQAGLIDFFNAVANAASAPVILYNIPYRTGVAMELDTIRSIARHPRVGAIKDCGGDPGLTMQLIADAQLDVLSGDDQQIFSTLCLGGAGAIIASAHVRPDLFVRLARLVQSGELASARQLFYGLLPLIQRLFEEPNPAGIKAALAINGAIKDTLRTPMQSASSATRMRLASELERLALLP
ncbi:4-hydroxy-tetrahydrodipicolinate synthase [soil metagenome]